MSKRVTDLTKWAWCLLVLHSGSIWTPVSGAKNQNPPSNPTTVEAQAKFFQDFFSVQLSPYKIEFGHVCEDPNNWEQRYEKKDYKNHRDMGKVRWGDKKGGYGEHYWDLNHAGHNNDNDDGNYNHDLDRNSQDHDDGYYNEPTNDAYDEPSQQTLTYDNDSYDPEKASQYNENERSKRAHHLKTRPERKMLPSTQEVYRRDIREGKRQKPRIYKVEETEDVNEEVTDDRDEPTTTRRPPPKHKKIHKAEKEKEDEYPYPADTKKLTLEDVPESKQQQHDTQEQQFVPYEGGAGVRQHYQAASVPRLFLEPSTGHVVDRTTGQAYMLQPIIPINNNNY